MDYLPKFSAAERLIIELLVEHDELFGLQMVAFSAGRLKRGTVYVTLGRMVERAISSRGRNRCPRARSDCRAGSIAPRLSRCEFSRRGRPRNRFIARVLSLRRDEGA